LWITRGGIIVAADVMEAGTEVVAVDEDNESESEEVDWKERNWELQVADNGHAGCVLVGGRAAGYW